MTIRDFHLNKSLLGHYLSPNDATQWWLSLWPTASIVSKWFTMAEQTKKISTGDNRGWNLRPKVKWGPKIHLQLQIIGIGAMKYNKMKIFEIITSKENGLTWNSISLAHEFNNPVIIITLKHTIIKFDYMIVIHFLASSALKLFPCVGQKICGLWKRDVFFLPW